jgi:hypothetical protein
VTPAYYGTAGDRIFPFQAGSYNTGTSKYSRDSESCPPKTGFRSIEVQYKTSIVVSPVAVAWKD